MKINKINLKSIINVIGILISITFLIFGLVACKNTSVNDSSSELFNNLLDNSVEQSQIIDENGTYTSKDEVALYIYTYKKLPRNFITKKEAKELGWVASKNNLDDVAKGKSIGGDVFSNYEKNLPVIDGRTYYECDIDFNGKKRNAKRIVYADDFDEDIGFIYYTDDHYKTFERLY